MSEVQPAVLAAVIISGAVAWFIGVSVGIWMEATKTKTWRNIADSRRDEINTLRDELTELKKTPNRFSEDL